MIADHLVTALETITGPAGIKTSEALRAIHPGSDPHNLDAGLMVLPKNVEQVSAIVKLCNDNRIAIVPHGGRTGLAGGAVSRKDEIILSLAALNRIESVEAAAETAIVECGVTLQALQEEAAKVNLTTGIDIPSRGSATIGGMISTNAGGMEAFRLGVMRQRVLGLEVVLPDGSIMSDLAEVTKSNEGYDLKQLFIGAEGTLGIVTRAVIRLTPADTFTATALVACPSAIAAVSLFQALRHDRSLRLLRTEIMGERYFRVAVEALGPASLAAFTEAPIYLIVETEGLDQQGAQSALENALGAAIENELVLDAIIAQSGKERNDIWNIREDSNVITRAYPNGYWFDISVPLQHLDAYIRQFDGGVASLGADVRGFAFGHLGDGNLHICVAGENGNPDKDAVKAVVYANIRQMGGSFSAEHGIGLEKMPELHALVDPVKLALMRTIKRTIDPNNIMNPGKVVS
ncbi:FAD-binding oxidoreductase [Phyllobacterium myrsinacearum]|uniref:FAD/FMN-containing dehydrogenase n=1 Tax=Phyllobacterium myrsinacearum TaxID=28101 RepID=A0A839EN71_9HYPH|nr:FAD-binding oxidoreductase [Phyllobacterium myrsinacearum]MBA8880299.1 FAD/FMN-containing dehydrogenase [Phyllobacterium myrsinacearum]